MLHPVPARSRKREKGGDRGRSVPDLDVAPSDAESHELLTVSGNGIYVTGLVNHRRVSVLLDTGATTSIIDEET